MIKSQVEGLPQRCESLLLKEHLGMILECGEYVRRTPKLFFCEIGEASFRTGFFACRDLPLGCLVLLWERGELTQACPICKGKLFVISALGEESECRIGRGICPGCKSIVGFTGGNLGAWCRAIAEVAIRYDNYRFSVETCEAEEFSCAFEAAAGRRTTVVRTPIHQPLSLPDAILHIARENAWREFEAEARRKNWTPEEIRQFANDVSYHREKDPSLYFETMKLSTAKAGEGAAKLTTLIQAFANSSSGLNATFEALAELGGGSAKKENLELSLSKKAKIVGAFDPQVNFLFCNEAETGRSLFNLMIEATHHSAATVSLDEEMATSAAIHAMAEIAREHSEGHPRSELLAKTLEICQRITGTMRDFLLPCGVNDLPAGERLCLGMAFFFADRETDSNSVEYQQEIGGYEFIAEGLFQLLDERKREGLLAFLQTIPGKKFFVERYRGMTPPIGRIFHCVVKDGKLEIIQVSGSA